jgi:CarboxypepD_reg-like domain/Secretion system C-terminal sorting domain
MKQKLQLQIPEPCHENWNNMDATQQGRFCLSCQKEVVDFSVMTDKEILNHISKASEKMCGRFGNDQLNRNLIPPQDPRKAGWKYWMSIAASFILLASKSNAQVKTLKADIICTPPKNVNNNLDHPLRGTLGGISVLRNDDYKKNYIVNGVIKDEYNNPLPGATVMIKDTNRGTTSDEKGKFSMKVIDSKNILLSVSFVGYETQEIKIESNQPLITVTMRSFTTQGLMGDVIIVKKRRRSLLSILKPNTVQSIKPQTESILKVYPNPVAIGADIKIKMDNIVDGNYMLSVFDINGNQIINKEIIIASKNIAESLKCDQRFNSGVYVLKISGNGKTITSKIIVQ